MFEYVNRSLHKSIDSYKKRKEGRKTMAGENPNHIDCYSPEKVTKTKTYVTGPE